MWQTTLRDGSPAHRRWCVRHLASITEAYEYASSAIRSTPLRFTRLIEEACQPDRVGSPFVQLLVIFSPPTSLAETVELITCMECPCPVSKGEETDYDILSLIVVMNGGVIAGAYNAADVGHTMR